MNWNFEMFNHKGTIEIIGTNIILRKFEINDSKEMFDSWASLDVVTQYLPWKSHKNIERTSFVISTWMNFYKRNDYYNWCIVNKETNEVMGNISLSNFNNLEFTCEVGYCLGYKFWNKGIMTEALKIICDFAFEKIGVSSIYSKCYEQNIPSCRVLKKSGFNYYTKEYSKSENNIIKKFVKYNNKY